MLVYEKEQVATNLENLFEFYEWVSSNQEAIDYYASGMEMKNDTIKELFKGTDGRIIIDTNDYTDFMLSMGFDEFRRYMNREFMYDAYHNLSGRDCLDSYFVDFLSNRYASLIKNCHWDEKGKVVSDSPLFPYKGQKFTKVLNTIFDSALASYTTIADATCSTDVDDQKHKVNYFKNNIIGGKLATIVSGNKVDEKNGKYVILSIRPEDLFTISVGNSWRSCMHPDGGEYNTGVLGYITGQDAMVAYTVDKQKFDEAIDKGSVKKIWREMMFISDTDKDTKALISQKGYPESNKALSDIIADVTLEMLGWKKHENVLRDVLDIIREDRPYGYVDMYNGGKDNLTSVFLENQIEERFYLVPIVQGTMKCVCCGKDSDSPSESYGYCSVCEDGGVYCAVTREWIDRVEVANGGAVSIDGAFVRTSVFEAKRGIVYSEHNSEYLLERHCVQLENGDYVRKSQAEKVVGIDGSNTHILKGTGFLWVTDGAKHSTEEPENAKEELLKQKSELVNQYSDDDIENGISDFNYYITRSSNRNDETISKIKKIQKMLIDLGIVEEFVFTEEYEFVWTLTPNAKDIKLSDAGICSDLIDKLQEDRFAVWKSNGTSFSKILEVSFE